MRGVATVLFIALAVMTISAAVVFAYHQDSGTGIAICDSKPSHPWNRLYAALWVRQDRHGNR
jgi:hypothetical protein